MKFCLKWVNKTGLAPTREVAGLIQRHQNNTLAFCRHWITNGVAEGLNSKVMAIKRKSYGHGNRDNFKTAISIFSVG